MKNESTKWASAVLTDAEKTESNLYVCYERTQYHYFKRNNGIDNFSWLFADRIFGFTYTEGNEPILPLENGFQKMISSLQEHYSINPDDLKAIFADKFSKGYQAFSLLTVRRPDSSSFNTSTLYEGMNSDTVFYTQTGWVDLITCLPIQIEELACRIPVNSEGKIDLWFLKAPSELLLRLKKEGISLLKEILIDCYGYQVENDKIIGADKLEKTVQTEGLAMLVDFLSNPDNLFSDGQISKRNQLRMHKHISNKMRPTLFAWNGITKCPDCRSAIGELAANSLSSHIAQCEHSIDELFKWTSIVNTTLNYKHYSRYLEVLNKLQAEYNLFQNMATIQMKRLISVAADSQQ